MMRFLRVFFYGGLVVLGGCAPMVVSTSPRTVVIRAGDMRIQESQTMADTECAKHGRYAKMVARPSFTSAEFIFDCVN